MLVIPGAGKTTLSRALTRRLGAVHFDAQQVRAAVSRDLGFSREDRIEEVRPMGWLCDQVVESGDPAIADFVCPLPEARARVGQACIAVRDRHGLGESNPFDFGFVQQRIHEAMREFAGRYIVVRLPNITNMFYGRDVGYQVERIDFNPALHAISATRLRAAIRAKG